MVLLALAAATPELSARVPSMAVSAESPHAARAALAVLKSGGNAADAMVTAVLVSGVTQPTSSGLGGGGFAMVWDAKARKSTVIDFREMAPAAVDAHSFEGRPLSKEMRGHMTGVPGEARGLFALHQRFGSMKWKDVVAPARKLASSGYFLGEHVAQVLPGMRAKLFGDPALKARYFLRGSVTRQGARLKNPALAKTLARLGLEGPRAFYEGPVARDIVQRVRGLGGPMTEKDLANYRVEIREALAVPWGDRTVYSMPPPSAGGLMLAEALKMLDPVQLRALGHNTGAYQHLLAEVMRGAIADRIRFLGDPKFETVDMAGLLAPARMQKRRARISLTRTHGIPRFDGEEHGTAHMVTRDAGGNMVSLTATVNRAFGIRAEAAASGVVLNDELDDFSSRSWVVPIGMKQSPNRPRPGARPVSSMTPTIVVRDGKAVLGIGGSGGMSIATGVTQTLLSLLVFEMSPTETLQAPRMRIPTRNSYIRLIAGAAPALIADLESRGEIVSIQKRDGSAVQIISADERGLRAAADPRKHGLALVY